MKMFQNWIQAIPLLLLCQRIVSASVEVKNEGEEVDIKCSPPHVGGLVLWFRVLDDNAGLEFIESFNRIDGSPKNVMSSIYDATKMKSNILVLKSFKKKRDSGTYSCVSINANKLFFGEATQLAGPDPPKIPTTSSAPLMTTVLNQPTTKQACVCNSGRVVKENPTGSCDPLMWAPLAGGCGLLLTLLIVTICYCNRIRTRRCPHHYKRHKPRMAPEKQAMANRAV